jgi:hypothetical protein
MDNTVELIVELENEKIKFEATVFEKKEKIVIVFFGTQYARDIEDNELLYKNKPNIYFGDQLVKKYVRLPYENIYEYDEEYGNICLFPKAKYEFYIE